MAKKSKAAQYQARSAGENRKRELRSRRAQKKLRWATDEGAVQEALSRGQDHEDLILVRIKDEMCRNLGEYDKDKYLILPDRTDHLLEKLAQRKARFLLMRFSTQLLNLLLTGPWIRDVGTWVPKGRSRESHFRSLVEHLLCKYPVPPFLFGVFGLRRRFDAGTDAMLDFFSEVAGGASAYKSAKKHIPIPMTKRMVHNFMQSTGKESLLFNLRRVQVEEFIADPAWGRRAHAALMRTFLGRDRTPSPELDESWWRNYEKFWETGIQWLGRQAMLDPQQIGPLVDYIGHARHEADNWSIQGRTVASLTRGMEEWHAILHKTRKVVGKAFEPSGYKALMWQENPTDNPDSCWLYRIEEILTTNALAAEGRAMRHCVLSYSYSIQNGGTSIWSLRRSSLQKESYWDEVAEEKKERWSELEPFSEATRMVTIEAIRQQDTVVQFLGKLNRLPTAQDRRRVVKWASQTGLKVK